MGEAVPPGLAVAEGGGGLSGVGATAGPIAFLAFAGWVGSKIFEERREYPTVHEQLAVKPTITPTSPQGQLDLDNALKASINRWHHRAALEGSGWERNPTDAEIQAIEAKYGSLQHMIIPNVQEFANWWQSLRDPGAAEEGID